ncbi:MAG TPA: 50S ribosomal protein L30 [Flavobacteriaceae bacterium]|jgi:large subunit ribosomal protein L30|nr:50S ribosomal protein L30 [Flavobacteriaceae bacterium]HJO70418.1 50S ribosomal protein L30 [Flavobacteriaceae bacterium]|tara:strand:+ start:620 stop:805 length:186 start_codon:yes stop_codon:yes gene_type:complete
MSKKVKIKQIKSTIKRLESQKRTLIALGLRRIGMEVEHELTPSINGMIQKVKHLVSINEIK